MKITWLGDGSSEETNEWNGITFTKGEAVDVTDERMIEAARGNKFYKVAGDKSETVEQVGFGAAPIPAGATEVRNAAFGGEKELEAHAEASKQMSEASDEARANALKMAGGRRRG